MPFLFDTNICIYVIKKKSPTLLAKLSTFPLDEISISSITIAELHFGVRKSAYPEKNLEAIEKFLTPFKIIDFDFMAAVEYGKIRATLEKKGTPIGSMDMLISSIAIYHNLILVTNNTREFSRVEGLQFENWV